MKLRTLSFEGDSVLDKKEMEKSNYCLISLNATTFGIANCSESADSGEAGSLLVCQSGGSKYLGLS